MLRSLFGSMEVALLGAALFADEPGRGEARAPLQAAPTAAPMRVTTEDGSPLDLISLAAYKAEFRFLRGVWHQIDLAGPAVETDGWTNNIPQAEWPFMGLSYLGYSAANLARIDPTFRDEALTEMRWLIEALQTLRMSGFLTPHFGPPFGRGEIRAAVFVHGHFLNLALRYRELTADPRYDPVIHKVAQALARDYAKAEQGILASYRGMWWITDNFPALSGLVRYDRQFGCHLSGVKDRFVANLKAHYLDHKTGMFCTFVDPTTSGQLQGPRGISEMYGLHFLKDFAPDFALEQYAAAKRCLLRQVLGLTGVKEFPAGAPTELDVASGPLIFGLGPSASGFGIAAAAIMGDTTTARHMIESSVAVGLPRYSNGQLNYLAMPSVGQTVVLFGKTCTLLARTSGVAPAPRAQPN